MNLSFQGLDELIAEIDRIDGLTDNLKDDALIVGGDILLDRMKQEVYAHGLHRRSGDAYESLTRTDPKNGELFVGVKGGDRVPGYYLYMHEKGYYNVRAKRFIDPKPFASIAYEMSKPEIMNAYVDVFRRGLRMT